VLGEWRYSSTHSLTATLDGDECRLDAPAALPPGKDPLVPVGEEAGWAPEPVWTLCRREEWIRDWSKHQVVCTVYSGCVPKNSWNE